MPALDPEPEVLRSVAAASAHAYEQAITHIEAEFAAANGIYEPLLATLTPEGPYAYTLLGEVRPDGSVRLPILTTYDEIAEAYAMIRGRSDLLEVLGITEIRGAWYTFQDSLTRGRLKGSDEINVNRVLGLFPSGRGTGITGELVWIWPRSMLGAPDEPNAAPDDPFLARAEVFDQFTRYLDALRANDADAVVAVLHDGVASALRDYVNDTGTLTDLEGKDAHRAYYQAFFDRYEVRSIQPIYQVTDEWFVFAELRVTVAPRAGDALTYHTAEYFMPSKDGRFIARIGHGTEPA
jgi:hypothetical protein